MVYEIDIALVRRGPRIDSNRDRWGIDLPSTQVDAIKSSLIDYFTALGLRERRYTVDADVECIAYTANAPFRKEEVLLDDGGTLVSKLNSPLTQEELLGLILGSNQAPEMDRVLKIAVREAHGVNLHISQRIFAMIPHESLRLNNTPEPETNVYSLKRFDNPNSH